MCFKQKSHGRKTEHEGGGINMAVLAMKNPNLFVANSSELSYVSKCKIDPKKRNNIQKRAESFEKTNIRVVNGDIDRSKITWSNKKK